MTDVQRSRLYIRRAQPAEYPAIGALAVDAYAMLPGMPSPAEQPGYYAMLRDVAARAGKPSLRVYVAVGEAGELHGSVDFIGEMVDYGSGGTAGTVTDAAGIRLLAVAPASRGRGAGKQLTLYCIERARELGRRKVVLHSTRAMQTAWAMYERLGFDRSAELDFRQGQLEVFGFALDIRPASDGATGSLR